ncbi:MAG: DUF3631 domain-containing protein, partial [Thermoleophilia bacterium]|nr:DUF3631 domain-containing protein [Thermoleophilia bacterium]
LDDRAQDGWEPLLAIADAAAGEWPARARGAALALSGGREAEDASTGVRLLADVRAVFEVREVDRISSADLCAALNAIEESPWGAWRDGKGIDPRTLARRLREYDVVPGTVRLSDGTTAKGYQRERFLDAWERYCPREQVPNAAAAPPDASRTSHRHNPHGDRDAAVTDGLNAGSIRHAQNPHGERDVTVCRTEGAQEGGNGSGTTNEPDPFELLRAAGLDPVEEADDGSWREVERLVDEAGLTIAVERRNGRAG